jgi:pectate lyase
MRCSPAIVAATVLCWTLPVIHSSSAEETATPSFQPVGFATVAGYGVERLTGGGNAPVVEVRTAAEFQAAAERRDIKKKADRENAPRVIKVMTDLDLGELATEPPGNELKAIGRVRVCSHTTLFAPGVGATLRHGIVESLNENPRPPVANPNSRVASEIEANFKSNVERGHLTFNPVTDWSWKDPHLLPYAFTPDPTAAVPEIVRRFAGTGKLSAADLAPAAH